MIKLLHEMSKKELIATIQDYQEMINDLEETVDESLIAYEGLISALTVRDIISKHIQEDKSRDASS